MRIALCYSGYPYYFDKTFLNHKSALIDLNSAKADIFAHFWVETHHGPGNFSRHPIKTHDKPTWKEFEKNVLKPTKIIWESPQTERFEKEAEINIRQQELELGNGWFNATTLLGTTHPRRSLSMFYGIEKSIGLALEYERTHSFKYDFIFRMRADLFFLRNNHLHKLGRYNSSKLNISPTRHGKRSTWTKDKRGAPMLVNPPSRCPGAREDYTAHMTPWNCNMLVNDDGVVGINDWFAFSGGKIMKKYCNAYSNCRKIIKEYLPTGPEAFLTAHIESKKLRVDENNWQLILYRALTVPAYSSVLEFNERFYI